ncbi:gag protein [Campylobacter gastrosuis]|uniref:Gag protein n=1 Tax=Campylobacter gastrosuis TaxID=2974576 RepID=A0ABT7HSU9_9BACT|nr:gag protein [Campylobacter gastrosuis]MDL0089919.1 gag protein [Campylobacter gastrosuis]
MPKIHKNVMYKKTRYDLSLSIQNASRFEQLCEAYEMKKSDMADFIIDSFCTGNLRYQNYLKNLDKKRTSLKNKAQDDISLFNLKDDENV